MKYELGSSVCFMKENKPQTGEVFTRMVVENKFEEKAVTDREKKLFTFFGPAGIFYVTSKGVVAESECYSSLNDLAKMLFPDLIK